VKGYKGFDKDFRCKDQQYEVGKEVTHEGKLELCSSGLHFCENPLDTLRYYQPASSRYAEVEAEGVAEQKSEDSKRVAKKLKIMAEVKLSSLIQLGVKFLLNKSEKPVTATSGNSSPAATSGNSSHAATSGDSSPAATSGYSSPAATSGNSSPAATSGNYSPAATSGNSSPAATSGNSSPAATSGYSSHAATSGDYSPAATSGNSSPAATSGNYSPAATSGNSSHAATSGDESIAAAIGREATAKAAKGNWIVLAEYEPDSAKVRTVKTVKVDGKKIKADTFYKLKKGKFVIAGA
jgi:hypothetical protein